ncbi:hypothetical protein H634G_11425 [Metarhizium anisopliae BRIP 53293]|uniref:Uncharacterized protein n=1 Tax=Metarhizium anisopliae BRIP 53293 TaxID=1291518 RepID=A0A0D9NHC0_METAN|nr:hypothetical protein H634G_11425 [Metarhizium anisopliae BRIP 53293]
MKQSEVLFLSKQFSFSCLADLLLPAEFDGVVYLRVVERRTRHPRWPTSATGITTRA